MVLVRPGPFRVLAEPIFFSLGEESGQPSIGRNRGNVREGEGDKDAYHLAPAHGFWDSKRQYIASSNHRLLYGLYH